MIFEDKGPMMFGLGFPVETNMQTIYSVQAQMVLSDILYNSEECLIINSTRKIYFLGTVFATMYKRSFLHRCLFV